MLFNRTILYGLLVSGVSLHLRAADESPVTAFMNEPRVVLHQWSPERARQKLVCDTLVESLCRRDQFVWLYFEEQNLLSGKTVDWHKAIESGKRNNCPLNRWDSLRFWVVDLVKDPCRMDL